MEEENTLIKAMVNINVNDQCPCQVKDETKEERQALLKRKVVRKTKIDNDADVEPKKRKYIRKTKKDQENSHECNEAIRGTYVYPNLIWTIASWISNSFAIGVNVIINEWRALSPSNNVRLFSLLANGMENERKNLSEEKQWQQVVFDAENKSNNNPYTEHQCVIHGRIDVLTKKRIIEIKNFNDVDRGIGQLFRYQECLREMKIYNNQELWLYVFFSKFDDFTSDEDKLFVKKVCQKHNIFVKFLN